MISNCNNHGAKTGRPYEVLSNNYSLANVSEQKIKVPGCPYFYFFFGELDGVFNPRTLGLKGAL